MFNGFNIFRKQACQDFNHYLNHPKRKYRRYEGSNLNKKYRKEEYIINVTTLNEFNFLLKIDLEVFYFYLKLNLTSFEVAPQSPEWNMEDTASQVGRRNETGLGTLK